MKEHIASSSSTSSFTAWVSNFFFFRKDHNHYCGPLRGLHLKNHSKWYMQTPKLKNYTYDGDLLQKCNIHRNALTALIRENIKIN